MMLLSWVLSHFHEEPFQIKQPPVGTPSWFLHPLRLSPAMSTEHKILGDAHFLCLSGKPSQITTVPLHWRSQFRLSLLSFIHLQLQEKPLKKSRQYQGSKWGTELTWQQAGNYYILSHLCALWPINQLAYMISFFYWSNPSIKELLFPP